MKSTKILNTSKFKLTTNTLTLNSYLETTTLIKANDIIQKNNFLLIFFFKTFHTILNQRYMANSVLYDMINNNRAWRQIRGYPMNGQTTHTNSKMSRKNKWLLNYRLDQFYLTFGVKKRNIYPTLIKAEYNNKLWYYNWYLEWFEASFFARKLANLQGRAGSFNPAVLATSQTNGYTRVGKAAKIGKAKKLTKMFTVGVPVFFTRYIYYQHPPHGFPTKLILRDEVNKKLGKKLRRKQR